MVRRAFGVVGAILLIAGGALWGFEDFTPAHAIVARSDAHADFIDSSVVNSGVAVDVDSSAGTVKRKHGPAQAQ